MNKTIVFLIAVLSIAFSSQISAQESNASYYTIQLGVFDNPKIEDFVSLDRHGFVYAMDENQPLKRVFLGGFDDKKPAVKILSKVKDMGYKDAFIIENKEENGAAVFLVQLASHRMAGQIDWSNLLKARPLFSFVEKGNIKIGGGQYADFSRAKEDVDYVKSLGFKDAFVKKINTARLHKVTSFEMEDAQVEVPIGVIVYEAAPTNEVLVAKGQSDIPQAYGETSKERLMPKSVSIPNIRAKVRRNSVAELQKVLKEQNVYVNAPDGYYGPATSNAIHEITASNPSFKKYQLLSSLSARGASKEVSALQAAINTLPFQSEKAVLDLENSDDPVAKVYKAYHLFVKGEKSQVNDLMNEAIKETFLEKKLNKNVAPFDFNASYAYNSLDQLILHLRYVQGAQHNIAAPCWLFQKHPEEAIKAFEPFEFMTPQEYEVEDCGNFMDWESIKLLKSIAADLDPNEANKNEEVAKKYSNKRARHYLAPRPLTVEQTAAVKIWNEELWNGLNDWANRDQVHRKFIVPLKVAYFQSQVLLEDYFLNRGLNERESTALALSTLQTIVAQHLDAYL